MHFLPFHMLFWHHVLLNETPFQGPSNLDVAYCNSFIGEDNYQSREVSSSTERFVENDGNLMQADFNKCHVCVTLLFSPTLLMSQNTADNVTKCP